MEKVVFIPAKYVRRIHVESLKTKIDMELAYLYEVLEKQRHDPTGGFAPTVETQLSRIKSVTAELLAADDSLPLR